MANTYSQLYIHIVFSVAGRRKLIQERYNDTLQKYITGIIKNRGHHLLAINNLPDHMHILIGIEPSTPISKLVQEIKAISSKYINEHKWVCGRFSWQKGYGVFSCCHWHVDQVKNYINNQQIHHKSLGFKEEYISFLNSENVEYDIKYVFDR
jgi:putative transposase